jgi:two-component system, LuxR family, sensor kinase FixL
MSLRHLDRNTRIALAGILIGVVALVDWRVDPPIAFGFLYLFPILLVGAVWPRWCIMALALFCTVLSDVFDPYPFTAAVSLPQDILVFTSLAGTGLFAFEVSRSRRRELENLRRVEREVAARRVAEEQLEFLIDSSPVAILIMAADCLVLRANQAAHRLLGVGEGQLAGRSIRRYLPALGRVPFLGETPQTFRTEMQ